MRLQNNTQSHVPFLKKILETFEINSVLEYGIGLFSTPIFLESCKRVVSIEMNSGYDGMTGKTETWYDKVVKEVGLKENWEHFNIPGPMNGIDYAIGLFKYENFDLVFADGHGDTRAYQANSANGVARFIVCHDTEHRHTRVKWDLGNYYMVDFPNFCSSYNWQRDPWPGTTIFCRDENDAQIVRTWFDQEDEICALNTKWI